MTGAAYVDHAVGSALETAAGDTLTVAVASTPDPGDLLVAAANWFDFADNSVGLGTPAGYRPLDIGLGKARPDYFNTGPFAFVWVHQCDGTETGIDVPILSHTRGVLVTLVRLSGALLAAGWNVGDLIANESGAPSNPHQAIFGFPNASDPGLALTTDDDGIGLVWFFQDDDNDTGAGFDPTWTEQFYEPLSMPLAFSHLSQVLYSAPLVAATPLAGPAASSGTSVNYTAVTLGLCQVATHLGLLVASVSGRTVSVPRQTGIALTPPPEVIRALAKNPPDPAERGVPGSPWIAKPGQYRPPA